MIPRWPTLTASLLAVAVVVLAGIYGSKTGGGSDSYGYVSEADLLLSGHVSISQPWTADVPWPSRFMFTPLGYRLGPAKWIVQPPFIHPDPPDRWAIVPTYAPGLPLLMAGAKWIAGHCAMFWVVPLMGGVLILATYGLGVRIGSPPAGLAAAWLVATSPPVVLLVQAPMSDVPAAAAWAVAIWGGCGTSLASAILSGIGTAVAIVIRPNLAPMAAIPVICTAVDVMRGWRASRVERPRRIARALAVIAGAIVGACVTGALFWAFYGSPFRSGYGSLEQLFSWSNVRPNLSAYTSWLMDVQTPVALLGVAALFLPAAWLWRGANRVALTAYAAAVVMMSALYFPYDVFDSPMYLRFMLPCWPFIMIGLAAVALAAGRLLTNARAAALATSAVVILLGLNGARTAAAKGWLNSGSGENKYAVVALAVRDLTTDRSLVYCDQHSGSLRYYGGRMTMGYGLGEWIGPSLTWLTERGVHPYALLEDYEVPRMKAQLAGRPELTLLERPPIFQYGSVRFFDLHPTPGTEAATIVLPVRQDNVCILPAPPPKVPWRQ